MKYYLNQNIIVNYFDNIFYKNTLKNLNKNSILPEKIKGKLEKDYKIYFFLLNNIYSEFYLLFELIFFCIYLTLIDFCNKKAIKIEDKTKEDKKEEEEEEEGEEEDEEGDEEDEEEEDEKVVNEIIEEDENGEKQKKEIEYFISDFILNYEEKNFYLNFINEEGYKHHIKNIYDEVFNNIQDELYDKQYKSTYELRNFFLKNKCFDFFLPNPDNMIYKIFIEKINITEKEKEKENFNYNNEKFLTNTHGKYKFFSNLNIIKFYNINFEENKKHNIFKDYLENYFNIIN